MKPDREECEGEEDVDQSFLDEVLNKLYDFGDAAKARKTKKSRQKRKRQPEEEDNLGSAEETCNDGGEVSHERLSSAPAAPSAATAGDAAPTPVKCNVEIVTFIDPLKKKRLTNTVEPEAKPREKKAKEVVDPEEFSIEKARLEVHRLGITGYQKTQQRDFEQDRAIMLGARPPKRQHINYKVYQQMMKERKTKAKEETKPQEMKKKKKGRVEKPKNDKRKPSSGAEPGTQVGRFKNGMLVLNSKDIHKLNGKMKK